VPRRVTREEAIAEAVRVGSRPRDRHRAVWIGIDGPAGAGKSDLAGAMAARVDRAVVVPVDHFSGPDVPEWDCDRFAAEVLAPVSGGMAGRYRQRTWDSDAPGSWHEVRPGSVVIVEGVSATREDIEVGVPWDLTVWVDAPEPVREARIRDRDGEAGWRRWSETWRPSEQRYIARERPFLRVDLVVAGG
jgi:uridine kinase